MEMMGEDHHTEIPGKALRDDREFQGGRLKIKRLRRAQGKHREIRGRS